MPPAWHRTVWFCSVYTEPPVRNNIKDITSVFVANASEIDQLLVYRDLTYRFESIYAWLDVALQTLKTVGWSPECSGYRQDNLAKKTPPTFKKSLFFPKARFGMEEQTMSATQEGRVGEQQLLFVHTGVIIIGDIGITACLITKDFAILSRTLYVHGRVLTEDKPLYMKEAAV